MIRSLRPLARWVAAALAVAIASPNALSAWRNFWLWREYRVVDPSAADLYLTNVEIDGVVAAVFLAAAVAILALTRTRRP